MNQRVPFCCEAPCNPCLDPGSSIMGVDSESADLFDFISVSRGSFGRVMGTPFQSPEQSPFSDDSQIKSVAYAEPPPLGSNWTQESCGQYYTSQISQEDANQSAMVKRQECLQTEWPPTVPPTTPNSKPNTYRLIYGNSQLDYLVDCPSGGSYTAHVVAGKFFEMSQEEADRDAREYARSYAGKFGFCLSDLAVKFFCYGSACEVSIDVSGGIPAPDCEPTKSTFDNTRESIYTFEIVAGELPPGLSWSTYVSPIIHQDNPVSAPEEDVPATEGGDVPPSPVDSPIENPDSPNSFSEIPTTPSEDLVVQEIVDRGLNSDELWWLNEVENVAGIPGELTDSVLVSLTANIPTFPQGTSIPGLGMYVDIANGKPVYGFDSQYAGPPSAMNRHDYNIVWIAQYRINHPSP